MRAIRTLDSADGRNAARARRARHAILSGVGCGALTGAALAGGPPTAQPRAGDPLDGLTPAERQLFDVGRVAYSTPFLASEGLGPIFNKAGCFSCHSNPLGGWGSISVTLFGTEDKGAFVPLEELGGNLLQLSAISSDCQETIPEEATVVVTRVTPSVLAFGLVEAIPADDIIALEDPFDTITPDGISGRAHIVESLEFPGTTALGRFGWKSQIASTLDFSADASRNEMGLTNRILPTENAPNGNMELLALCDDFPDPEDGPDEDGFHFIDRVTHFQRYLAPPPQTPRSGMTGEQIFTNVGCAACHTPSFTTSTDESLEEALRGKEVKVYSDFLLHDMGLLGDGIAQGAAFENEMRTAPLWNLRTRDPMLHDGSASGGTFESRVTTAIMRHGPFGEGAASAAAFDALDPAEKASMIQFLDSLGRVEFDFDGDGDVDGFDLATMRGCSEIDSVISPDEACAIGDIDQDGDVDADDFVVFQTSFDGEDGDCNGNGVADLVDIFVGTSLDEDFDGVPDECVACIGDIDGSGAVDGADLGVVLAEWGSTSPTTPADLDGNGVVDGADLAIVLGLWGPCNVSK